MPLHKGEFPILDYDDNPEAVIQPGRVLHPRDDMPERVVLCFFQDVLAAVCAEKPVVFTLKSEHGPTPITRLETDSGPVAVLHPGVGAPLAGAFLEEAIALGGRKFVACGGAGVLVKSIAQGHVIVPERAIRDEGTSYHYLPAGAEARAHPDAVAAITQTLEKHAVPYDMGTTWTMDAIYRETRARVGERVAQGCLTVEMEAAAFMAIAQFRGVVFGQLLYGGDDLAAEEWNDRGWQKDMTTREKLFWLAVESVCAL